MTPELVSWMIGSVVLHALWQGVFIGIAVLVAFRLLRSHHATSRYSVAVGGLFGFLVTVIATAIWLAADPEFGSSAPIMSTVPSSAALDSRGPSGTSLVFGTLADADPKGRHAIEFVAWFWWIGVAAMSLRLLFQWIRSRRIRTRGILPPSFDLKQVFDRVRRNVAIDLNVDLRMSRLIDSPMVLGWIRPIVVLPTSTVTSLTPEQLETILTHELIHIARRDHLVNMIQAFVEIALFFHPVTWWLSRQIRIERENCCDDATIEAGGSPRNLAEALLALEALRIEKQPTQAAIAATGGSLMNRIERLFESNRGSRRANGWRMISACTAIAMGGLLLGMPLIDTPSFAQDAGGRSAESGKTKAASAKQTSKMDAAKRKARIDARMKMMAEDLRRQVAAGEITMEEADAKYTEAEERMMRRVRAAEGRSKTSAGDGEAVDLKALKSTIDQRLKMLAGSLKRQVAAGEMTAEEGDKKFKEAESRMWARYGAAEEKAAGRSKVDLDELKAQIEGRLKTLGRSLREQVAAGEMSAEDARKKYQAAETTMWSRYRAAEAAQAGGEGAGEMPDLRELRMKARERLQGYSDLLKERVEAGEITIEEAEAEYEEAEKKVRRRVRAAFEKQRSADATPANGGGELAELKASIENRLRMLGQDLRRRVADGELTADDARSKFEAAEKQMWNRYRQAETKKD